MQNLAKNLLPESTVGLIREKMAQCLYTIQQFYSNTNWVEIHGETIFKEFGIAESLQININDLSECTCADCPTDTNSISSGMCKNNILSTTKLTSGYKSGQDVSKPLISTSRKGKCSHGSSDDDSRHSTATGGIYKGRSTSAHAPHYHLHFQAFEAAKQASVYFLSDEDNGLMNILGFTLFKEVLSIKTKQENSAIKSLSITFVIDVTGSMRDNIESVREATTRYVELLRISENVPEKYILVTFSDPGATMSNNKSTVYIITDAPAKDESREAEVISVLQRKNLTPKFLITPECSVRKKRKAAGRHKRSSSVYDRIAQATGGSVNRVQTSELQAIVEADLTGDIPSSVAVIRWITMQASDPSVFNIEVDRSVLYLSIFISGLRNTNGLNNLFNFNDFLLDTSVNFNSSEELILNHVGSTGTISIKSPEKGQWSLERLSSDLWIVNVTSNSKFDFTLTLNERLNGIPFPVKGNPISDENYTLIADLENFPANYSVSSLLFVDEEGKSILELIPSLLSITPRLQYLVDFNLNFSNKASGVQLHGKDSEGDLYVRSSPFEINPVDISLSVVPYTGELPLFKNEKLFYTTTNHGSIDKTVSVTVTDDRGYIVGGGSSVAYLIPAGESVTRSFEIRGTEALSIVTVNITISESSESLQSLRQSFVVSSAVQPSCSITTVDNNCSNMTLTARNCSDFQWRGNAVVEYSGTNLSSLHVSSSSVSVTHSGLSALSGPVDAELVGDCCTSSVVLSAVDVDGYFSQCRFLLYPENWVASAFVTDTSEPLKSVETSINIAVAGGIVAALVVIFIVLLVVRKNCCSSCRKTTPTNDKPKPIVELFSEKQNDHFHCTPPADSRYPTSARADWTFEYSKP
ncbi:uncharacterized protein LOC134279455 [Saccostrea cucullata]|uniref:uncharacterized protein LOC134279455 n=1 Tax=Saccostrea cuccullata TaxID=36930 RepID=UPI002ED54FA1